MVKNLAEDQLKTVKFPGSGKIKQPVFSLEVLDFIPVSRLIAI
jgi:hypothetical protein